MLERPRGGEKAVLVHVDFLLEDSQENLQEFQALAESANVMVEAIVISHRKTIEPKYFVGEGKAEEIKQHVAACGADVVLVNHALSPSQERNLEKLAQCRVLDRTGLILDIFAQRARTFEGKLQVELAQLHHLSTRLVRGWTHLERQKGGIGLRGPGETQLETDRRLLRARIKTINARLEKVRMQREQNRAARKKADIPTLAIVGYTNAGKSTLFKAITHENVYVANQLFATLDPTLRRFDLADFGPIILADTVGFIRHLPHQLVDSFRATLEETLNADLLLHVIDSHVDERQDNIEQVNLVLAEIGADKIPQLEIYNKIDLFPQGKAKLDRDSDGQVRRVWISASKRLGFAELFQAITERLSRDVVCRELCLMPHQHSLRSTLYDMQAVLTEMTDENGHTTLTVRLPKREFNRLFKEILHT